MTTQDKWGSPGIVYPIGHASIALFDRVLPTMFASITRVESLPPFAQNNPKVVAVIEPMIDRFEKIRFNITEISYRFNVYSSDGKLITTWTLEGAGRTEPKIFGSTWQDQSANLALQDAALKFMTGFRDFPGIRRWLIGMGIADGQ